MVHLAPSSAPPLCTLYPEIEPYMTGMLRVSSLHAIYFEQCGNPDGIPVVVLHGGPGSGSYAQLRRFFDPATYRIILFDQRGCGKSTPFLELAENRTADLVEDIEKIRRTLGIPAWAVFGGSWGSTLALVYAETYPEKVTALFLRGIFLGRQHEIDWLYEGARPSSSGGLRLIAGDRWKKFASLVPPSERMTMVEAYWQRLSSKKKDLQLKWAREWWRWESMNSCLVSDPAEVEDELEDENAVRAIALIECHYFRSACFLAPNQILRRAHKIAHIPGVIVQGFYDLVCPAGSAVELSRALPQLELVLNYRSGHAAREPENTHALIEATDKFRDRLA